MRKSVQFVILHTLRNTNVCHIFQRYFTNISVIKGDLKPEVLTVLISEPILSGLEKVQSLHILGNHSCKFCFNIIPYLILQSSNWSSFRSLSHQNCICIFSPCPTHRYILSLIILRDLAEEQALAYRLLPRLPMV